MEDGPENLWRWRSTRVASIGAPLGAAGAILWTGLVAGHVTRGCADHPCVTQRTSDLGPNVDYGGGTANTPVIGQKV
jgi:hypothetical protein